MYLLNRKKVITAGILFIFVILPIAYISFGNYNISQSLNRSEEIEYLQVIYSLGASMIILGYYGMKWILKKGTGVLSFVTIINLLGIISLYLLFKTIDSQLLMAADIYYLIVYAEIVIVHLLHHLMAKSF